MKWIRIFSILLLWCSTSAAQQENFKKEIDEQVWKPFIRSFNTRDNITFRSVHSKEITRVMQDDRSIQDYSEYFHEMPDSITTKWKVWEQRIELRFIQRIASANKAFEVGYYKSSSRNTETGEKRVGYGKFHVLLQKEDGKWKILMDADAAEKTTEEIFLTGTPID